MSTQPLITRFEAALEAAKSVAIPSADEMNDSTNWPTKHIQELSYALFALPQSIFQEDTQQQTTLLSTLKISLHHLGASRALWQALRKAMIAGEDTQYDIDALCSYTGQSTRLADAAIRKVLHTPLARDYTDSAVTIVHRSFDVVFVVERILKTEWVSVDIGIECIMCACDLLFGVLTRRELAAAAIKWEPPIATNENALTTLFDAMITVAMHVRAAQLAKPVRFPRVKRAFASPYADKSLAAVLGAIACMALALDDKAPEIAAGKLADTQKPAMLDNGEIIRAAKSRHIEAYLDIAKRPISLRAYVMWLEATHNMLRNNDFRDILTEHGLGEIIEHHIEPVDNRSISLVRHLIELYDATDDEASESSLRQNSQHTYTNSLEMDSKVVPSQIASDTLSPHGNTPENHEIENTTSNVSSGSVDKSTETARVNRATKNKPNISVECSKSARTPTSSSPGKSRQIPFSAQKSAEID